MNKTEDIEDAIRFALAYADGPLTLEEMERRLPDAIQAIDRRWIGIAVYRMLDDGRIRAVGCEHGTHEGACVVEAAR